MSREFASADSQTEFLSAYFPSVKGDRNLNILLAVLNHNFDYIKNIHGILQIMVEEKMYNISCKELQTLGVQTC
jgi:hypothetical protein